ncbi:hypothetical protein E4U44_002806 [Claviceps purpurea]|nr:hypothetical protein E4U45_004346 [Claviceps purpurea]KAG6313133.1 hypothetical protein E4U44_002806 [Claviceps purpurea]
MDLTRQHIYQLHHHLLQRLQSRARLPVLSVPTYDVVRTARILSTAKSRTRLITSVGQILDQGFIPLLFDDVVFDLASGPNMLSGDALMRILAMSLDAVQRCIIVTGVAGIYTRNPKVFEDDMLFRQLRYISTDTDQEACDEPDATGAMDSKWQWVQRITSAKPSTVKSRKRIEHWLLLVMSGTRTPRQAEI